MSYKLEIRPVSQTQWFLKALLSCHFQLFSKTVYTLANMGIILLGTINSSRGFFLNLWLSYGENSWIRSWSCTGDKICTDYSSAMDQKGDKSHWNIASMFHSACILDLRKGLRARQISPEANHCQSPDALYAQRSKLPLAAARSAQFCIYKETVLQHVLNEAGEQCFNMFWTKQEPAASALLSPFSPGKVVSLQLQKLPDNPMRYPKMQTHTDWPGTFRWARTAMTIIRRKQTQTTFRRWWGGLQFFVVL